MAVLAIPIAADSSYATAVFGLVGVLVGAVIAGGVSLWTAKETREALSALGFVNGARASYPA